MGVCLQFRDDDTEAQYLAPVHKAIKWSVHKASKWPVEDRDKQKVPVSLYHWFPGYNNNVSISSQ